MPVNSCSSSQSIEQQQDWIVLDNLYKKIHEEIERKLNPHSSTRTHHKGEKKKIKAILKRAKEEFSSIEAIFFIIAEIKDIKKCVEFIGISLDRDMNKLVQIIGQIEQLPGLMLYEKQYPANALYDFIQVSEKFSELSDFSNKQREWISSLIKPKGIEQNALMFCLCNKLELVPLILSSMEKLSIEQQLAIYNQVNSKGEHALLMAASNAPESLDSMIKSLSNMGLNLPAKEISNAVISSNQQQRTATSSLTAHSMFMEKASAPCLEDKAEKQLEDFTGESILGLSK